MDQVDLLSIGSYTELPGGNIALPQGYSSLLAPIINVRVITTYIDISIIYLVLSTLSLLRTFPRPTS